MAKIHDEVQDWRAVVYDCSGIPNIELSEQAAGHSLISTGTFLNESKSFGCLLDNVLDVIL